MRSGIPDLPSRRHFYPAELASSATEVFRKLPDPEVPPGSETNYTTTNYVLLGTILEHATGRPWPRSCVRMCSTTRARESPTRSRMPWPGDGWGVKSTSASLAPVPPLSRDLNDAAPFRDPGANRSANAPIATASGRMHPMPILVPERAGQRHTLTLDAPVATTERRLSRRRSPVQIWSGARSGHVIDGRRKRVSPPSRCGMCRAGRAERPAS